ncbi:MAG TPA: DUF4826 family protein [Deltaproteobacteria bacterium]|jgi:hypothetical protein|nr:DUF4826 family protein [Deltaproteobacteria bacterium]
MTASDELKWLDILRQRACEYLEQRGLWGLRIDDTPAWHRAPYSCIWAARNEENPAWGDWWVICGGLPTDCVSAVFAGSARNAMHAIGSRWIEAARCMKEGDTRPATWTGLEEASPELADLLEIRGEFLVSWSGDDACWDPEWPF